MATINAESTEFGMVMGIVLLGVISVAFILATGSGFIYRTPTFILVIHTQREKDEVMESEDEEPLTEIMEAIQLAIAEKNKADG